jgi:broad specificity phosphatase PhoE
MAQYDEDEFDFDTDSGDGSDLVKQLRKQVKELSSALKERDEQLEYFETVSREQDIAEILTEYGVNPRIANFVPDDIEDEDQLVDWLGANAEVFGIEVVEDEGISVDPESVQAAELMSAVEEGGIDPQIGFSLESKIQNASTPEELQAILKG